MNTLTQIAAVTAMNLRSLPQRIGSSIVVVVGIAGVVGVLVSVMAMSSGLAGALTSAARPGHALVLSSGTTNEGGSSLGTADVQTIVDAPGIRRGEDGEAMASPELFVAVKVTRIDDGGETGLQVRGVSPRGFALRPELELVEGRMFQPGLRELVVGRGATREFANLEIGDEVMLRDGPWKIVGVFETGGTVGEAALMTDASTLQSSYQRPAFNSVRVWLESDSAFSTFADALTTNPTLNVNVITEEDYFAEAAKSLEPLFFVITNVVGSIMALGALFAALNTMYTAVSSRTTEIATLRAIGFGSSGVVASVLSESLLLAVAGALLGATVAWLLFNGNTISLGDDGGSLVASMQVTPLVIGAGVVWACVVGAIGGLFPAVRAARLPVAEAIRAS
jgi:putative ABC transport system permease protein